MEGEPAVLGSQLAAAAAAEQRRLASGRAASSPLAGRGYDFEGGEFDLTRVVPLPLDRDIEGLVRMWQGLVPAEREALTGSLSLDDNYTLIQFAKRMAVRALNEPAREPLGLGLLALAMIDDSRIDPRDASWAAGLLSHAACGSQAESANLFAQAVAMAAPGMGRILRESEGSSTLEDWGYRQRSTSGGIGLIRSGWERYAPTRDLAEIAARIAERVLIERYVTEIEIATGLPSIWFAQEHRQHAEEMLGEALGIAQISGSLRKAFGPQASQMFFAWIAEMPSSEVSAELVAAVGGVTREQSFAVGVSADRWFSLLVAGSAQVGVAPYESEASVRALAENVRTVLVELVSKGPDREGRVRETG